jgi:hypothetical protein
MIDVKMSRGPMLYPFLVVGNFIYLLLMGMEKGEKRI